MSKYSAVDMYITKLDAILKDCGQNEQLISK